MNKKYLQIAFNSDASRVSDAITSLPDSHAIMLEAGTSFIKRYGAAGIQLMQNAWQQSHASPAYIVADLKCMDRGSTEIKLAKNAGASAATVLGLAPLETIQEFITQSYALNIDPVLDMLNVEFPFEILGKLKTLPKIVVLHLGVDQRMKKEKQIPYHDISSIKGTYDVTLAIAGGETVRDVQRAFFNGTDIAVVWEAFAQNLSNSTAIAQEFLATIH